jgi:hypothetical protein
VRRFAESFGEVSMFISKVWRTEARFPHSLFTN